MDMKPDKIANLLRRFVSGGVSDWEFDDFVSSRNENEFLEGVRQEIIDIPNIYPSGDPNVYASSNGMGRLLEIAEELDTDTGL